MCKFSYFKVPLLLIQVFNLNDLHRKVRLIGGDAVKQLHMFSVKCSRGIKTPQHWAVEQRNCVLWSDGAPSSKIGRAQV